MDVTWEIIKTFSNSKGLIIHYVDIGNRYWIKLFDGKFELVTNIQKTDPAGEEQLDFETNYKAKANAPQPPPSPFSSKTFGTKKLFKRIHGVTSAVTAGSSDIIFTIPYAWVKITGVQIVGGESLDTISMMVLDSTTGTYTTIPNSILNQFGFAVNVVKDNFIYDSEYDADLYVDMQIKIVYNSASSKTIGFNFILNEVKS